MNINFNLTKSWAGFSRLKESNGSKNSKITKGFLLSTVIGSMSHISPATASEQLVYTGDILQFAIPTVAGMVSIGHRDFEGLGQLVEGAVWTAATTHLSKFAIDAERPNGGSHSFPSGHTSAATQGAAYLQFRYGWRYGLPAYMAAGIVGYSRVEGNYHYWRDVAAGAALASGIQYAITGMGVSATDFVIAPMLNEKTVGLYASVNF